MSYQQEKFKEIADAIREKTGTTDLIKPSEFADKIEDVYVAGQNAGSGGYDEGFADGRQTEKRERWDKHMEALKNGWNYAFAGSGITDETFTPYTDIKMSAGYNIIGLFTNSSITNLKGILEKYGTTLDLSKGANSQNLFNASKVTHIPRLLLDSATSLGLAFSSCTDLVSIDELYAPKITSANGWSNTFQKCTSLEELRITSEIKYNSFDVHWSTKLSHESLMSILTALADKTTDTSGTDWVCTLGTDNLNKLSDTEKAVATGKGWVLA